MKYFIAYSPSLLKSLIVIKDRLRYCSRWLNSRSFINANRAYFFTLFQEMSSSISDVLTFRISEMRRRLMSLRLARARLSIRMQLGLFFNCERISLTKIVFMRQLLRRSSSSCKVFSRKDYSASHDFGPTSLWYMQIDRRVLVCAMPLMIKESMSSTKELRSRIILRTPDTFLSDCSSALQSPRLSEYPHKERVLSLIRVMAGSGATYSFSQPS